MGDLNGAARPHRRHGHARRDDTVIKAQVPMSEMLTYEQHLRSATQRPRLVPHGVLALRRGAAHLQTKIIAQSKSKVSETSQV